MAVEVRKCPYFQRRMAHGLYIPIPPSHNLLKPNSFIHLFIHPTGTCRIRFLAVLWSFFHSSLLYTYSCHPSLPTILPSSLTSSYHLFLGLPLHLLVSSSYIILYFLPFSVHAQTNQWRTEGWDGCPPNSEVLTKLSRIPSSMETTSVTT
jgi:hypothetical protein